MNLRLVGMSYGVDEQVVYGDAYVFDVRRPVPHVDLTLEGPAGHVVFRKTPAEAHRFLIGESYAIELGGAEDE